MHNNKIGKELYWRFAKFENLLKNNIDIELTRVFGKYWIENIVRKNEIDKDKIQLSLQDIDALECLNQNDVQFMGIINDLSVEYCRANGQKDKLSLGFWVNIVENWRFIEDIICSVGNGIHFANVGNIFFVEKVFKNIMWAGLHNEKTVLILNNARKTMITHNGVRYSGETFNTLSSAYKQIFKDLHLLQSLRNDFCHFRFDISKLEETKILLDKCIFLIEKPQNIKPKQKEQDNPTSDKFIKNIQADNPEIDENNDFEKNIKKVIKYKKNV